MAGKILTREEAMAMTEKKVAMTLDEIIQMSKKASFNGRKHARTPVGNPFFRGVLSADRSLTDGKMLQNKSRGFAKGVVYQSRPTKVQSFLNSRSLIRQGALAQRRSNFMENQFPLTAEVAKRATFLPFQRKAVNWNKPRFPIVKSKAGISQFAREGQRRPKTLDARFARMKEQRIKVLPRQMKVATVRRPNTLLRRNLPTPFQRRQGQVGGHPRGNVGRRYNKLVNYQ